MEQWSDEQQRLNFNPRLQTDSLSRLANATSLCKRIWPYVTCAPTCMSCKEYIL